MDPSEPGWEGDPEEWGYRNLFAGCAVLSFGLVLVLAVVILIALAVQQAGGG